MELKDLQVRCDALVAENAVLKSVVEPLKTQITVLEGELATAKKVAATPAEVPVERLDALVEERASVIALAKANDVDTAGKPNIAIKRAIVAKRTPALKDRVDSLSTESLDVALAAYKDAPHPTLASAVSVLGASGPATRTGSTQTVVSPRQKFLTEMSNEWQSTGSVTVIAPGSLLNNRREQTGGINLSQTVGA